jgi:hypothetical protein
MSQRSRFRDTAFWLLAAVVSGLTVAGAAYVCAYFDQRNHFSHQDRQLYTVQKLDGLEGAIKKHRHGTGQFPADLNEMPVVKIYHQFTVNAEGRVVDMWDHPYQYRVEGDSFELFSLGADGKPGGLGRDADLYPSSMGRPPEVPTLRQFTFDLPTEGVQRTCILAGMCAALVCLLVTRSRRGARLLSRMAVTVIGAIIIAIALSALQLPASH